MRPASSASYWPSTSSSASKPRGTAGRTFRSYRVPCLPQRLLLRHPGLRLRKSGIMFEPCVGNAKNMENTTCNMPGLGEKAPEFEAETTQGHIRFPQDFKGKWIILFSHPGDFTPVCTSEFMLFGKMQEEFHALGCQLLGLSVGALTSHIAWLRSIREKIEYKGIRNLDIRFPLIADLTMDVARRYGMIQPGASTTAAVRTVFFIDPHGIVRTFLCYPAVLGRNFDELKRILVGLQTIDAYNVALPADWHPGDDVIAPSGSTMEAIDRRTGTPDEGARCYDWYFCTKPLSEEKVTAGTKH